VVAWGREGEEDDGGAKGRMMVKGINLQISRVSKSTYPHDMRTIVSTSI
jgi:hypothetical protein